MARYSITLRDEAFLYLYKIFHSHLVGVNAAYADVQNDWDFKQLNNERRLTVEVINAVKDAIKVEGTNV